MTITPRYTSDRTVPIDAAAAIELAEGRSNRNIAEQLLVSRRTVATHLEHVFQKLGHANRVELAADATRRSSG